MIFLVVTTEFLAQAVRGRRVRRHPGAFAANAIAVPLRSLSETALETGFVVLWWGHVVVLAAFLLFIPTNKHFHVYTSFINICYRKLAPRGELPKLDIEDENATVRAQDPAGPRLEGPARRLHLHRMRSLPAGLSGLQHRASRSTPRPSSWASATCPVDAEHGLDIIPNSPIVRETYGLDDTTVPATLAGHADRRHAPSRTTRCGTA